MSRHLVSASALLALLVFVGNTSAQENNKPPAGFRAVFNGKDLSGWHGMGHFNPYELHKMSEADRKAKRDADTADAKKHWSVENGELVNDGHGALHDDE